MAVSPQGTAPPIHFRRMSGLIGVLGLLVLLPVLPPPALCQIPDLTWDTPQVVDSPVASISSPAGEQVAYWNAVWSIAYEKDGRIWFASLGPSGWSAPTAITTLGIPSRNPHLVDVSGYDTPRVMVVWEDDRRGHSEIWSREYDGTQWTAEGSPSDDAIDSRASAVAGGEGGFAYLAWEDSTAGLFRAKGREYVSGSWRSVEQISSNPASCREPTVGYEEWMYRYHIAWTDYRDGTARVFYRDRDVGGYWGAEESLVSGRRASIHAESCCGDALGLTDFLLAYEAPGSGGATESRGLCYMVGPGRSFPLSPDDGVPSVRPHATGFDFLASYCNPLGGLAPKFYATWTDIHGQGSNLLTISDACRSTLSQDLLSNVGVAGCGAAAREGHPATEILAYWIESVAGAPSLITRMGHTPGCTNVTVEVPPVLMIAPEGNPPTVVRAIDRCIGAPMPNLPVAIWFDDVLDAALTWDPTQTHPTINGISGPDGYATFSIRGGGCSQAGLAVVTCNDGGDVEQWEGAKSPDIDGDCAVRSDDVDYVRIRIGTADFCADLDGSGRVDSADLAIVVSALGDHCSDVTAVEAGSDAQPSLRVSPNPVTARAILRLESPRAGGREIRLYDAAGRLVRAFDAADAARGAAVGAMVVEWDTRDAAGREVPSGIYFAVVRGGGGAELRRAVVVIR